MKINKFIFFGLILLILLCEYISFEYLKVSARDSVEVTQFVEFIRLAFWMTCGVLVSGFIFLFLNDYLLKKWLKYILSWFLPVSFIVVSVGDSGSQILQVPKSALALFMGGLLVFVTIVFVVGYPIYSRTKNKK